jgi:large subunit ribosomal protein L5
MGVKEQIIFPEIDYGTGGQVRGMDITITTTASSDVEAFALLSALGMPFSQQGRPRDFFELFGEPQEPSDASQDADDATEHAEKESTD